MDLDVLARSFGFNLKSEQKEAVDVRFLLGRNVFAVLPTGFGKSLIYQLFVLMKNSGLPNALNAASSVAFTCRWQTIIVIRQALVNIQLYLQCDMYVTSKL